MSIDKIDFDILSNDQIIEKLKKNQKEANYMRKEIERLKKVELEQIVKEINKKEDNHIEGQKQLVEESEEQIDFKNTVDYYYSELETIKNTDDLYNRIKDILPSKNNYDYNKILVNIKFELLKSIKETHEFIHFFKMDINKSDLLTYKEEIKLYQEKINAISKIQNEPPKQDEDNKEVKNKLIFTTTSGGNIRALEELDHIDSAYYNKFKGLFDSIIDKTFKNVKKFNSNNDLTSGVCEVKDHKVRVVYKRLGDNEYAIIAVFIKKSDNDKGYKEQLINKIDEFRNQEDKLKELIKNEEFMAENAFYTEELYNKLNVKEKASKVIKKVDDSNE